MKTNGNKMTLALVLRVSPEDIERLGELISSGGFELIYRTTSYGPLYINQTRHDD